MLHLWNIAHNNGALKAVQELADNLQTTHGSVQASHRIRVVSEYSRPTKALRPSPL